MPMLTNEEFTARFEAAMALRREREGREARGGTDHLKDKSEAGVSSSNDKKKKKKNSNARMSKRQLRQQERLGTAAATTAIPNAEESSEEDVEEMEEENELVPEEAPEINPNQCLFDRHISSDVNANAEYMYKKYGFFIPDQEFMIDLEGLIGYCAEKIKLGHTCLYCQKTFRSWRGCQEHMINSSHCKLRYEADVDLEEFDVFYDFTADNEEFLKSGIGNHKRKGKKSKQAAAAGDHDDEPMEVVNEDENVDEDDDDEEWEDVDSDEDMEDDDDDGMYAAYEDEVARHGFDITPLGELIFPDGRIIGHRGLNRYYKQRFAPEDNRTSVISARRANGERLLNGRVYDTYAMAQEEQQNGEHDHATALQLAKAGLSIGAAQGRAGKGILVPTGGNSNGASYTALSLYRYRAAIKKARKQEFQGRRLQQRTTLAMNKMDKKGNRLTNNVSVAHAPR